MVPGVRAATARLLESEEQVDESGEVDAGGSAIMESGHATAAGIASRPRIWGRSSKVGLLNIYPLLVVGTQTKGNAKCSQEQLSCLVCSVEIYDSRALGT